MIQGNPNPPFYSQNKFFGPPFLFHGSGFHSPQPSKRVSPDNFGDFWDWIRVLEPLSNAFTWTGFDSNPNRGSSYQLLAWHRWSSCLGSIFGGNPWFLCVCVCLPSFFFRGPQPPHEERDAYPWSVRSLELVFVGGGFGVWEWQRGLSLLSLEPASLRSPRLPEDKEGLTLPTALVSI